MLERGTLCRRLSLSCWAARETFPGNFSTATTTMVPSLPPPCATCPYGSRGLSDWSCPGRPLCIVLNRYAPTRLYQTSSRYSSSHINESNNCYYCSAPLSQDHHLGWLRCEACLCLQPPSSFHLSHFDLLNEGVESFEIDFGRVKQKYLQLQRALHPDQFSPGPKADEPAKAGDWSARINQAFNTLRSPLKRAIYLYGLQSGQSYDPEAAASTSSLTDEELAEILEMREILEFSTDFEECQAIQDEARERMSRIERDLAETFRLRQFDQVKRLIDRANFIKTILDAAEIKVGSLT